MNHLISRFDMQELPLSLIHCFTRSLDYCFFSKNSMVKLIIEYYVMIGIAAVIGVANVVAIYGIVWKRWMVIPKYTKLIAWTLTLSLIHTILALVLLFIPSFVVGVWINWALSLSGTWTLNLLFIAQLELLILFSPIVTYWTPHLINTLKWVSMLIQFVFCFPAYIFPVHSFNLGPRPFILALHSVISFNQWQTNGTVTYVAILSLFSFWEVTYLMIKIYKHQKKENPASMQLRAKEIMRFKVIYIAIELMDLFGLALYTFRTSISILIAFEIFHLRVVLFVFIFLQLRTITFVKDKRRKKPPVVVEKNSTHLPETIQMSPIDGSEKAY
jgi:hypothetical protein